MKEKRAAPSWETQVRNNVIQAAVNGSLDPKHTSKRATIRLRYEGKNI